jgi:UDP-3-O-[3-hydroxymyristoyl] glucosamine N-acyltransferase
VTLRELAQWVGGELVGDGDLTIRSARPLGEAQPGDLTFAEGERNLHQLHHSPAAAAVVSNATKPNGKPIIRVHDPIMAFARIVERLRPPEDAPKGIHPSSSIHPTATIGEGARVDAFAVIGPGCVIGANCRIGNGVSIAANCRLGDDVTLHPHVALYDGVTLGHRVIIHANAVIGADGFGYRTHDGRHVKVPQLGHVEIGDDVEIGACATIDRGTFGPTRIGAGTKIDNLVMIAHNCQIGRHNLLVGQVGIAGSSSTGDHVIMAGQVGVRDHIHIGDRAVIAAQSGVRTPVSDGEHMLGYPALPESIQHRIWVTVEKLPSMRKMLRRIQKHLGIPDDE